MAASTIILFKKIRVNSKNKIDYKTQTISRSTLLFY